MAIPEYKADNFVYNIESANFLASSWSMRRVSNDSRAVISIRLAMQIYFIITWKENLSYKMIISNLSKIG